MSSPVKDKKLTEISPRDSMFEGNREHYFAVGHSAIRCIQSAMTAAGKTQARTVLDFASGYGRVLRALKSIFPAADLTACDLSQDALDFCSKTFGSHSVQASENIADIKLNNRFDLIWCGTLLTNVDAPVWSDLLNLLHSRLAPGGLLVFTTHGPFVARRLRPGGSDYGLSNELARTLTNGYEQDGFGYVDYPAEVLNAIGMKKYGFSVSRPSWVCRQIESLPGSRIITYTERAWDNHQDSVACTNQ